jgi:uncharacterized repeat protein (TIGR01451 family)
MRSVARLVVLPCAALLAVVAPAAADAPAPLTVATQPDAPRVLVGQRTGYTISVTNPNPVLIGIGTLTQPLPGGFRYVPGSTSSQTRLDPLAGDGNLVWTNPFNAVGGATSSLHFTLVAPQHPGEWRVSAGATVDPPYAVAPVDLASAPALTVDAAPLWIGLRVLHARVARGAVATYVLTARNPNPVPVTLATLRVELPLGFTLVRAVRGAGAAGARVLRWRELALAADQRLEITLRARVAPRPGRYVAGAGATTRDGFVVAGNRAVAAIRVR